MNNYFTSIHNERFELELLKNLKGLKKIPLPTTYSERIYLYSILKEDAAKNFFDKKEFQLINTLLNSPENKKKSSQIYKKWHEFETRKNNVFLLKKATMPTPIYSKFIEPILKSILNYEKILITTNNSTTLELIPYRLEFDILDQEFYLVAYNLKSNSLLNNLKLNNITTLKLIQIDYSKFVSYQNIVSNKLSALKKCKCTIVISKQFLPDRNRILLLLSPYKKIVSELNDNSLEIALVYEKKDKAILLMKLLSLGTYIKLSKNSDLYYDYLNAIKNTISNY